MKKHDLDPVSLVFGVVFAVVGVMSLLDHADVIDIDGRWLWPGVLIALGLMGLMTALRPDRDRHHDTGEDADEAATPR
jgi:branched-subunit amino acid permease